MSSVEFTESMLRVNVFKLLGHFLSPDVAYAGQKIVGFLCVCFKLCTIVNHDWTAWIMYIHKVLFADLIHT